MSFSLWSPPIGGCTTPNPLVAPLMLDTTRNVLYGGCDHQITAHHPPSLTHCSTSLITNHHVAQPTSSHHLAQPTIGSHIQRPSTISSHRPPQPTHRPLLNPTSHWPTQRWMVARYGGRLPRMITDSGLKTIIWPNHPQGPCGWLWPPPSEATPNQLLGVAGRHIHTFFEVFIFICFQIYFLN